MTIQTPKNTNIPIYMRTTGSDSRFLYILRKIWVGIWAGFGVLIFTAPGLLVGLFLLLGPASSALQVLLGGNNFLEGLLGDNSLSITPDQVNNLIGNCILVALSGAATGIVISLVRMRYIFKHKLSEAFLGSIFCKEVFTQHPYVIGYIILNTLVGLAVGAIGGASGATGLFNLTGWFDASYHLVLTSATFSLQAFVSIFAGSGGEGGILWLLILFLVIIVQAILTGLLAGLLVSTIQGAFLGFVRGASLGFFKALIFLPLKGKYTRYIIKDVKNESRIFILKASCKEGAATGVLCGAIIGFIHGLIAMTGLIIV